MSLTVRAPAAREAGLPEIALALIERIYEAAARPAAWDDFVRELAEAMGGVSVAVLLRLPDSSAGGVFFASGFEPPSDAVLKTFARHVARGLPWETAGTRNFVGRFGLGSEVFPDDRVADTDFFREMMKPSELAPLCPIGHTIAVEEGRVLASVVVYRKEGAGPAFAPEDTALVDLLVPHLARAYRSHAHIHQNRAIAETLDRIPLGLILLDSAHQPVATNRIARDILDLEDGLTIDRAGPRASRTNENRVLQRILRDATQVEGERMPEGNVMAVSRPSGKRAFPLMTSPLMSARELSVLHDAVAVLYVSNLEGSREDHAEVLRRLYSLTRAETELVDLLCEGSTLDEAAQRRGVTTNTARSQLKQIFAKTGTNRQAELVRLTLACFTPIRNP
jgi:DNA-binding CsgD family transcriptional regulator